MKTRTNRVWRRGFTAVEMLITVAISGSVLVAILSVYITCIQSWHRTTLSISTTQEATHCLDQMVYGVGTGFGMRAAYSVTNLASTTNWILLSSNFSGLAWFSYNPAKTTVTYSNAAKSQIIGTNIASSTATSTASNVYIALTVLKTDGRYSESNTVRTFVKIRAPMTK